MDNIIDLRQPLTLTPAHLTFFGRLGALLGGFDCHYEDGAEFSFHNPGGGIFLLVSLENKEIEFTQRGNFTNELYYAVCGVASCFDSSFEVIAPS